MASEATFAWDPRKDGVNYKKHGVRFETAQKAFLDSRRVIAVDAKHSTREERRMFCYGKVDDRILTVRFVVRHGTIRIFGAGFWREGRRKYEEANDLH
ncbi:MAG: BrnT family toxin [Chitinivibrionales bacterium]|nr:BrnT family toxin [Chitinivibrionales bacterium]